MKIGIIGIGYVGLVSGVCFADLGNTVICMDNDHKKIDRLQNGHIPFFEQGLQERLTRAFDANRLSFTTSIETLVNDATIIISAVGTPSKADGSVNLTYVFEVIESILFALKDKQMDQKIIVSKSTVPIGTNQKIKDMIESAGYTSDQIAVVSNPEFLREGSSIHDFFHPDRIVLGGDNPEALEKVATLYDPLYRIKTPIIKTDLETAELSKYASNAFLATKISFANEMAALCEKVGANIQDVSKIMGMDGRIGPYFLHTGPGYGGSCFPKDTAALHHIGKQVGQSLEIVEATQKVNKKQIPRIMRHIDAFFPDGIAGRRFAILGLAFKQNTDDIRDSSALLLINHILERGGTVTAFDPEAIENTKKQLGDTIQYAENSYEAVDNADAVVLVTEWNLFRDLDLVRIKDLMRTPFFFDLRRLYSEDKLREAGFNYYIIGQKPDERIVKVADILDHTMVQV